MSVVEASRSFKFVAKGPFTDKDFAVIFSNLTKHAEVETIFFDQRNTLGSAATLVFSTQETKKRLRQIFAQIPGIKVTDITDEEKLNEVGDDSDE